MNIKHENITLIENWLNSNNYTIQMTDDFIRKTYKEVLEPFFKIKDVISLKRKDRFYRLQYDFVRRDLLKLLYKRNGLSAKNIKAGYVYAIGNPAWKDFIKIGSTIDVLDRLRSYQTSSPLRDYYIIDYFCTYDRLEVEKQVHSLFDRNSEWCKISEESIKVIFKKLKVDNNIKVL